MLNLADAGLHSFRERKLDRIIKGFNKKGALIKSAPFYQGDLTFAHLQRNLDMISQIILDSSLSGDVAGITEIGAQFIRARQLLDDAASLLSTNQVDVATKRLIELRFFVDIIHAFLRDVLMKKRHVSVGFNSGDGD